MIDPAPAPAAAPTVSPTAPEAPPPRRFPPLWRVSLDVVLAAALIVGGVLASQHLLESRPRAKRTPAPRRPALVEVRPVQAETRRVTLTASGPVVPARQLTLFAEVSGTVTEVAPGLEPGGLLAKGDPVVRVDPRDYELAVLSARTKLIQAQSQVKLERGQQRVAKRELELVGTELDDPSLVLRQPQLTSVKAAVSAARAAYDQARLNVERTTLPAPFDAVVRARTVFAGSRVTPATPLATLVDTAAWWVEITLPVDELRWLTVPRRHGEPGSTARIYDEAAWGADAHRTGQVVRRAPDLDPGGRLARLYVAVADPLGLAAPAPTMSLDAWVRVELDGVVLERVVRLDRGLVREGKRVWVMTPERTLDVRDVTIAYADRDHVLITAGLAAGDLVIASDLPAPVPGMALRTADEADPATPGPVGAAGAAGSAGAAGAPAGVADVPRKEAGAQ